MLALFPHKLNRWYGLPAQGVAVDDFADDNFDHSGLDFIGGGNLWVYSDQRPIAAASMPTFGRAPRWGSQWKSFVSENADRWVNSYLQKTTLPYEDNYLDLHPTVKDPLGDPVIRITADHKDNEKRIAAFVQDKMEQWFLEAGAVATLRQPVGTMGVSTHAYGGTRMGDDPETNVVDRWGFCHEVPNLGLLGASVMGTSGAHNPTLTAQALAWRTAERLVADWRSIAGSRLRQLPSPGGPHPVGSATCEITDSSRTSHLLSQDLGRKMFIKCWYPVSETARDTCRQERLWEQLRDEPNMPGFAKLLLWPAMKVMTNSYRDAPYATRLGSPRVLIYSHGLISFASENSMLMEHLASHGYLVIALQHVDQLAELRGLQRSQPQGEKQEQARLQRKPRRLPSRTSGAVERVFSDRFEYEPDRVWPVR